MSRNIRDLNPTNPCQSAEHVTGKVIQMNQLDATMIY